MMMKRILQRFDSYTATPLALPTNHDVTPALINNNFINSEANHIT